MSQPKVSICRIVVYTLNEENIQDIQRQRERNAVLGTTAKAGDSFPMIVTRVNENDTINGKVMLDSEDTLWVSEVKEATLLGQPKPGCWSWPPRI